jgi:hypothetical protein
MVDIMTALATASQAIKLAQDLRSIDKAMDAAEYKLKIAELSGALSDIKLALVEAKDELASKQSEIDKLKGTFARVQETVEIRGYKYDKNAEGKPTGRAYCPVCEQKGTLMHLSKLGPMQQCPSCKAVYQNVTSYA